MKQFTIIFFALFCIGLNYSCTEPEEEEEETIDLTTDIIGSYIGSSNLAEGGGFFTEDDRATTITRSSDSTIVFNMTSISPDGVVFSGTMTNNNTFTVKEEAIYNTGSFDGMGSLSGDSLSVTLSDGGTIFTFLGSK